MSLKSHRYAIYSLLVHVHTSDNYVNIYTSYELYAIKVSPESLVYIFHINDIYP